jgi:hypothetical protein
VYPAAVEYHAIGHVRSNPSVRGVVDEIPATGVWEPIFRLKYSGFVFKNADEM